MAEYLVIILAFTYMLVNFFFTSFSKKTKADKLSLKAREAIRDGNFEIDTTSLKRYAFKLNK